MTQQYFHADAKSSFSAKLPLWAALWLHTQWFRLGCSVVVLPVCFCFISKRFIKTRPNCKMKRIWTFNGLMVGFSTGLSRKMNWLLPTFDLWWACEDNPVVSKTEFLSSEKRNTNSYSLSSAQGYIPFEFSNCVGFLDSTMNQTNYKRKLPFST